MILRKLCYNVRSFSEMSTRIKLRMWMNPQTRAEMINKSGVFHPIFFLQELTPYVFQNIFFPGNTLTLEFIRSPNHFALLTPDNTKSYKITLLDMVLEGRQFLPPEAIESKLQKKAEWFLFLHSNHTSRSSHKRSSCRDL